MVTADDIAGLVVGPRLAAATNYATILPGKAWLGRAPDNPAGYPYCVFQVEASEAKLSSGGPYSQAWTVKLAAYVPVGATGVDSLAVQKLYFDALCSQAANTALKAIALRNSGDKVLHGRTMAGNHSYAASLQEGRDVFVSGLTVEILVQGDRGSL